MVNDFLDEWGDIAQCNLENGNLADVIDEKFAELKTWKNAGEMAYHKVSDMVDSLDMLNGIIRDLDADVVAWFAELVKGCNYDGRMRLDHVVEHVDRAWNDMVGLDHVLHKELGKLKEQED